MNIQLKFMAPMILCCALCFTACDEEEGDDNSLLLLRPGTTFDNATTPGEAVTLKIGRKTATMIYANNQDSITFPTGTGDATTATLTRKFFMAGTEVTNAQFATVLQWALDHDKIIESSDTDVHNRVNELTVRYGTRELIDLDRNDTYPQNRMKISYNSSRDKFSVASGYENHPVVCVSWYGAIMFCNWLTEMKDGNADNLVYSNMLFISNTWMPGDTIETASNTGYRLPSDAEWEYAARYRETDSVNTVAGYTSPCFTRGNSASNATTYYNDNSTGSGEPGKSANDAVAVYYNYWNGSTWIDTGVTEVAEVKSLGPASANALGIYDMSGNVDEWCWTVVNLSERVYRGGAWSLTAFDLQVGYFKSTSPGTADIAVLNDNRGFRLARTQ